jgi:hypothetical protein
MYTAQLGKVRHSNLRVLTRESSFIERGNLWFAYSTAPGRGTIFANLSEELQRNAVRGYDS